MKLITQTLNGLMPVVLVVTMTLAFTVTFPGRPVRAALWACLAICVFGVLWSLMLAILDARAHRARRKAMTKRV